MYVRNLYPWLDTYKYLCKKGGGVVRISDPLRLTKYSRLYINALISFLRAFFCTLTLKHSFPFRSLTIWMFNINTKWVVKVVFGS